MIQKKESDPRGTGYVKYQVMTPFNIFQECRHPFKADGLCLNKSGVRLLTSNIFYSVHLLPRTAGKTNQYN